MLYNYACTHTLIILIILNNIYILQSKNQPFDREDNFSKELK